MNKSTMIRLSTTNNLDVDTLIEEAWARRLADAKQSMQLSEQALSLAESRSYIVGIALALRNLSDLHKINHEYTLSLQKSERAIRLLIENNLSDHSAMFDLYLIASAAHVRLGDLSESLAYCYRAEDIALSEGDDSRKAAVFKTIGNVHLLSGNFDKAVEIYTKASAVFESMGDLQGKIIILNNMCHCMHQANRYEAALAYGLQGLEIYEQHQQTLALPQRVYAYNLNNVGQAYIKSENFEEAEPFFIKALACFQEEEDIYGETYSWRGLGEIYLHRGKLDTALQHLNKAFILSEKSGIAAELVKSHLALSQAYKKLNHFETALYHHEQFYFHEKRILNDETEKKIRSLETRYEIEKAQKEAEIFQLKNVALQNEISKREKAQIEAEKATKAKSEFLANMSHEIRTPLNGVIGITELLHNTNLDEQQQELTSIIKNSGETLLRIINDILDFSKIDAGKLELEIAPFSVRHSIEDAIDLLAAKAYKKGLEIGYVMQPDLPGILLGDALRFQQIIVNLLGNGIKFTEEGEVFVFINGRFTPTSLFELQVEVRDTGVGISEEGIGKLFQSFNQVHSSVTRKFGGTGLGLAISKQLAELMGGTMWVESKAGVGSSFHFTVQLEAISAAHAANRHSAAENFLLLAVDDSESFLQSIACKTAVLNIDTLITDTHQAALDMLNRFSVDAILIDAVMPDGTVDSFRKHVHAQMGEKAPPIFALMPFVDQPTVVQNSQTLTKPVRLEALRSFFQAMSQSKPIQTDETIRSTKNGPDYSMINILLAEDNRVNQKVIHLMLAHLGCQVAIVNDGAEAVAAAQQNSYDLILMDIQMPVMDGIEATRRIQAQAGTGKRPFIVAVTANALKGEQERLLALGIDSFVSKPIHIHDLTAVLKTVYEKSNGR